MYIFRELNFYSVYLLGTDAKAGLFHAQFVHQ